MFAAENRQFLLDEDALESRSWQIYAENGVNKILIQQSNGTNPKINKLSPRQVAEYFNATQREANYSVRIVKDDSISLLIRANKIYFLSFDGGLNFQKFVCFEVQESRTQGVSWTLILGRQQ